MQMGRLEADESAEQIQGPDTILGLYKEVIKFEEEDLRQSV